MKGVFSQFEKPQGFWGSVVGRLMARGNVELNVWALSMLDIQPTDNVLEIGFGPGVAIEMVSQMSKSGFIAGVDYSDVMLRQAQKRNSVSVQEGRVKLLLADVTNLPDFDHMFDKVVSVNSVLIWNDPVKGLQTIRKRMSSGALISITVQPRTKGATDDTTREIGEKISAYLGQSGFSVIKTVIKQMRPISAVCVIASR